jgi:hypothetical protein
MKILAEGGLSLDVAVNCSRVELTVPTVAGFQLLFINENPVPTATGLQLFSIDENHAQALVLALQAAIAEIQARAVQRG